MNTLNTILLTIGISYIFSKLYASHDAMAEKDGRKESLKHGPRLAIRILFSVYVGIIAHLDFSLDALLIMAISFLSFHLMFDVEKNKFSGKPKWYLSKDSNNTDRIWNWISPKRPGLVSFIVELVLLVALSGWYYLKAFL